MFFVWANRLLCLSSLVPPQLRTTGGPCPYVRLLIACGFRALPIRSFITRLSSAKPAYVYAEMALFLISNHQIINLYFIRVSSIYGFLLKLSVHCVIDVSFLIDRKEVLGKPWSDVLFQLIDCGFCSSAILNPSSINVFFLFFISVCVVFRE